MHFIRQNVLSKRIIQRKIESKISDMEILVKEEKQWVSLVRQEREKQWSPFYWPVEVEDNMENCKKYLEFVEEDNKRLLPIIEERLRPILLFVKDCVEYAERNNIKIRFRNKRDTDELLKLIRDL